MRVRMLRQYERSYSHPVHGSLTLVFAAGTTQHFDTVTAQQLLGATENGRPTPIAETYPEESVRVAMKRTTEIDGVRFEKGGLVHFPIDVAQQLLDAKDAKGNASPAAELAPDEDADHEQATIDEAVEVAIARKLAAEEAERRRQEIKQLTAAAAAASAATAPDQDAE